MPLLVFHDVCWPLARRDQYAAPDRIPPEHRHPYGEDIKLVPGNPGTAERGLPFEWGALEEGGPRNGVMTAIEDFMAEHDGLRLAVIPIFFGCGLLWPESAALVRRGRRDRRPVGPEPDPGAGREGPRDPAGPAALPRAGDRRALQATRSKLEEAVRRILASGAFSAAEWLSKVRRRGKPAFSRQELSDLVAESERARREDQR